MCLSASRLVGASRRGPAQGRTGQNRRGKAAAETRGGADGQETKGCHDRGAAAERATDCLLPDPSSLYVLMPRSLSASKPRRPGSCARCTLRWSSRRTSDASRRRRRRWRKRRGAIMAFPQPYLAHGVQAAPGAAESPGCTAQGARRGSIIHQLPLSSAHSLTECQARAERKERGL